MENSGEIVLIALGTFVMTLISGGIIFFALYYSKKIQLKKIAAELTAKKQRDEFYLTLSQAQENEKLRLARNLHDEVTPLLAAIKNNLQVNRLTNQNESLNLDYEESIRLVDQAAEVVKHTSYDLVPPFLVRFGVLKALQQYTEQLANPSLKVDFTYHDSERSLDFLSHHQQLYIFRICLEIMSNILKHSRPKKLSLDIGQENNFLVFLFTHDGIGINNDEIQKAKSGSHGLGLQSMQARIELLSGKINYFSDDIISKVEFVIPIEK